MPDIAPLHSVDGPQGALRVRVDRPSGDAVPLLLLHSDGGRLEQWDEVVDAIGDAHPLARLDFRGHGGSAPARDDDYSFAGRANDALAVLDRLGWGRAVLVAHSGGNGAAMKAAVAEPGRIAAVLMVDPPSDSAFLPDEVRTGFVEGLAGDDSLEYMREYYRTIAGAEEHVVARVLADAGATTAGSRKGLGPALLTWSPELVDCVTAPKRVVGTDVTDSPAAIWAERPDLPHTVVHGTGHWVNIERPDAVAGELSRLLDEVG